MFPGIKINLVSGNYCKIILEVSEEKMLPEN